MQNYLGLYIGPKTIPPLLNKDNIFPPPEICRNSLLVQPFLLYFCPFCDHFTIYLCPYILSFLLFLNFFFFFPSLFYTKEQPCKIINMRSMLQQKICSQGIFEIISICKLIFYLILSLVFLLLIIFMRTLKKIIRKVISGGGKGKTAWRF